MKEEFISFEEIVEINKEKRYVIAVVQSPGLDATEKEITERAHTFVQKWMKIPGTLALQSYIAPVDFNIEDKTVKQGSWILKLGVHDDEVWEDLTGEPSEDEEEISAEIDRAGDQRDLEKSATTSNVAREIDVFFNKEAHMTGEQQEKIIKTLTEGNLTQAAHQLIMKEAAEIIEADPTLSEAAALEKVMKTDYGKACYRLHSASYRRETRTSGLGPVAKEVLERKERLIEKSGARLSEGEAYEKVFKADPDLYRRYVREVEVSTAVG